MPNGQLSRLRPRVWILDDSPLEATVVESLLAAEYSTTVFDDGAAMLEHLTVSSQQPDLLVLDWQLPHVTGLEVCEAVRRRYHESVLPVLMVTTSHRDSSEAVAALRAGANDFVTRPFAPPEFRQRVSTLVRIRALHARAEREFAGQREYHRAAHAAYEALNRVTVTLADQLDPAAILGQLTREAVALCGATAGVFIPSVDGLDPVSVGDTSKRAADRDPDALGGGATHAPDESQLDLVVPVRSRSGETMGRLCLVGLVALDETRAQLARRMADQAAVALANARLYKSLDAAADALRVELAVRERFIAQLGHDLRTPIAAVLLSAATLLRDPTLPPSATRAAHRIASSGGRMERLVDALIDLAQTHGGRTLTVTLAEVDLAAVVASVVDELAVVHPGRRVVASVAGDSRGEWDGERLAQVVCNLVCNALAYGRPGSDVVVALHGTADRVVMSVHNEGEPIPPGLRAQLFEPFRRGGGHHDSEGEGQPRRGLGLGLFIVDQIVRAHGGAVRVESTADEGTTFYVELPRARSHAPGPVTRP